MLSIALRTAPRPFLVSSETGQRCWPLMVLMHSGFADTAKTGIA